MGGPCTYLCQGCYHLVHDECDQACRFCLAPCLCFCHVTPPPGPRPEHHTGEIISIEDLRKRRGKK